MKWLKKKTSKPGPVYRVFLEKLPTGATKHEQNQRALANAMLRTEPVPKLVEKLEGHVSTGELTHNFAVSVLSGLLEKISSHEKSLSGEMMIRGATRPQTFPGEMKEWRETPGATLHDHPLSPVLIQWVGASGYIETPTGKGVAIDLYRKTFNINLKPGKK